MTFRCGGSGREVLTRCARAHSLAPQRRQRRPPAQLLGARTSHSRLAATRGGAARANLTRRSLRQQEAVAAARRGVSNARPAFPECRECLLQGLSKAPQPAFLVVAQSRTAIKPRISLGLHSSTQVQLQACLWRCGCTPLRCAIEEGSVRGQASGALPLEHSVTPHHPCPCVCQALNSSRKRLFAGSRPSRARPIEHRPLYLHPDAASAA